MSKPIDELLDKARAECGIRLANRPRCSSCGSRQILYRRKTRMYWCRVCGAEWFKPERKDTD